MSTPATQEVRAASKWLRISPRKARLVVEHIRGRTVPEARTVLAFTDRAAAREVEKLLRSAVSNAEANHNLIGDDLVVKAVFVDAGPVIKRWRARARGRSVRIRKRTCHITMTLVPGVTATVTRAEPATTEEKPKRTPRRKAAPKAKAETKRSAEGTAKAEGKAEGQGQGGDSEEEGTRKEERERLLMGQKVHPGGMRVGVIHDWKSNWYTGTKEFPAGAARGHQDPRAHLQQALARGALGRAHPQGQAADHDRHLHRSPGNRHRQVRCRGGRPPQRDPRHDPQERPHQHQRDQAPRARREARRPVDRRAAPEPRQLPPRDEALARLGDALGRARREGAVRRPARRH